MLGTTDSKVASRSPQAGQIISTLKKSHALGLEPAPMSNKTISGYLVGHPPA